MMNIKIYEVKIKVKRGFCVVLCLVSMVAMSSCDLNLKNEEPSKTSLPMQTVLPTSTIAKQPDYLDLIKFSVDEIVEVKIERSESFINSNDSDNHYETTVTNVSVTDEKTINEIYNLFNKKKVCEMSNQTTIQSLTGKNYIFTFISNSGNETIVVSTNLNNFEILSEDSRKFYNYDQTDKDSYSAAKLVETDIIRENLMKLVDAQCTVVNKIKTK